MSSTNHRAPHNAVSCHFLPQNTPSQRILSPQPAYSLSRVTDFLSCSLIRMTSSYTIREDTHISEQILYTFYLSDITSKFLWSGALHALSTHTAKGQYSSPRHIHKRCQNLNNHQFQPRHIKRLTQYSRTSDFDN